MKKINKKDNFLKNKKKEKTLEMSIKKLTENLARTGNLSKTLSLRKQTLKKIIWTKTV